MKKIIVLILIIIFPVALFPQDFSDNVIVFSLLESLPSSKGKLEEYLWNDLPDIPSEKLFSNVTTENWHEKFHSYSNSLLKKTVELNLDSEFLKNCLSAVKKDSGGEFAYLPVSAYYSDINGNPVWVIVVFWEYPSGYNENNEIEHGTFSHIRMFVYNKKIELVGFNTCL